MHHVEKALGHRHAEQDEPFGVAVVGEVRFIRNALELSQDALAGCLGAHRVSVARRESGEAPLDGPTSVAIRALAAIPVMARWSTVKTRERVKASFDWPLTSDPPGSYALKAVG